MLYILFILILVLRDTYPDELDKAHPLEIDCVFLHQTVIVEGKDELSKPTRSHGSGDILVEYRHVDPLEGRFK